MRWNELAGIMDQHFDAERCMEKIRAIYDTDRWFSYKRNLETADYCERTMREAGLVQVKRLPLRADGKTRYGDFDIPKAWHAEHAILRFADSELQKEDRIPQEFFVLADYAKMPCSLVMYTPSTPEAGVEAEVVEVSSLSSGDKNIGMEALRGKMLLVNVPVAQALAFANQVGAVGILSDFIPLIPGVRNSREEFYDDCPWMGMDEENKNQVFGFHLTPRKGDFLRNLLKNGPLKLFADIKTERYDGISYTISGALEGTDPSLPEIFAYGHIYEPGANDNASGSAVLMELMEAFNELIGKGILPRPKRTIRVAMGYECSGSVGYLAVHKERKRLCAAVVDMVGTENVDRARLSLRYDPLANWSFADVAMEAANRIYKEYKGQEYGCVNCDFNMGTDNVIADPVFEMPTVAMVESPAFGYHSSMDHPDRIEPEILRRNAAILGIYIYGLADADRETCSFLEQEIRNQIADRMASQVIERRRLLWAEAGGRAIKSLEKIQKRETDPVIERFTEAVPDYAMEKGKKVPVRKVQGCLCSILWDLRECDGWSKLGGVELNTMLFWADGERSLWDIALHTAVEMNKCTDEEIQEEYKMAAAFFEDLIEVSAVEWRKEHSYG